VRVAATKRAVVNCRRIHSERAASSKISVAAMLRSRGVRAMMVLI